MYIPLIFHLYTYFVVSFYKIQAHVCFKLFISTEFVLGSSDVRLMMFKHRLRHRKVQTWNRRFIWKLIFSHFLFMRSIDFGHLSCKMQHCTLPVVRNGDKVPVK